MTRKRTFNRQKSFIYIFIAFLIVYGLVVSIRSFQESMFLDASDRINVMFYGKKTTLMSFGLTDNVNYIMVFNPEHKVQVPGGYDEYKVASLGRLSDIEEDEELIRRSFSSAISGIVDYYVMPKESKIEDKGGTASPEFSRLKLIQTLFSPDMKSNMNFMDRIFLASTIVKRRQSDFVVLKPVSNVDEDSGDIYFYEDGFQKKYKGFFFHQSLREEGYAVQILYDNYESATILSRVIEGQGIRIVDLSRLDDARTGRCTIQHALDEVSKTVHFLAQQFDCVIEKGDVEGSDIILVLGKELEEEWK